MLEAIGRLGASARFDGHQVTLVRTKRGLPGFGERQAHVSQIGGVEWQPAGLINDGFIRFTVAGTVAQHGRLGHQATAARFDPWAVPFFRKQQPAFEVLRAAVEHARAGGPAEVAPAQDVASQLRQLAELLDRGLLSRGEFEQQKARLLTGL